MHRLTYYTAQYAQMQPFFPDNLIFYEQFSRNAWGDPAGPGRAGLSVTCFDPWL